MKQSLLLILSICILFSCQQEREITTETKSKIDQKQEPYDHEMLRTFGPEPSLENIQAYHKSTQLAINEDQSRSDIFNGEWSLQGPGNIGGRINTIAVHETNSAIIYAGFARGGLWKTDDWGTSWEPLWNDMSPRSISAIALVPNSNTIYVGTGDVNVSGSPYVGDGIYKSEDGGETWTNIGLQNNYIISDIKINSTDPNKLVVSTMGLPFIEGPDRGIFYSDDAGATWTQSLQINTQTGVANLASQNMNPETLLAGSWTRIRNGKQSIVSGTGSAVYRSTDSGISWDKINFDVPDTMGRVAVTFSQQTAGLAYAMFITPDHRFHSLHKSVDAGENWATIAVQDGNTPTMMGGFAWFFGKIASVIDPDDGVEKLFLCGVDLWSFNEEIEEWQMQTPPWWQYSVHADKHDILNDADNNLIIGTDGGLYKTEGNETWDDIENIPTNMFYRVAVNPIEGDQYYGGMQDNGTSGGNSTVINDWPRIFGGDGFQMAFDPNNSDISYVETQNGRIYANDGYGYFYLDQFPVDGDRRNWDMPYLISPHNPEVLYTGTYRAVQINGTGGFYEFEPISESLTDSVEFITSYHTVTTLDESPLEEGLLYYGTADGNVWRGENGNFTSISEGLPKFYISSIKASPDVVDRVYVTLSAFLFNDNNPRIFRSDDRGDTWTSIGEDLPTQAVNDIVIYDEYQDSIMFAGTNIGVYATIDAGETWERLGETLPYVPVRDMEINKISNNLVAGTYGNSINTYPIDSIIAVFNKKDIDVKIDNELDITIELYPNPVVNQLTIESEKSTSIEIFSTIGEQVIKRNAQKQHKIDCSNFTVGSYVVKIQDSKSGLSTTRKFIKK